MLASPESPLSTTHHHQLCACLLPTQTPRKMDNPLPKQHALREPTACLLTLSHTADRLTLAWGMLQMREKMPSSLQAGRVQGQAGTGVHQATLNTPLMTRGLVCSLGCVVGPANGGVICATQADDCVVEQTEGRKLLLTCGRSRQGVRQPALAGQPVVDSRRQQQQWQCSVNESSKHFRSWTSIKQAAYINLNPSRGSLLKEDKRLPHTCHS